MNLIIGYVDPQLGDRESPLRCFDELEAISKDELRGSFYAGLDIGKQMDHIVLAMVQKINDKRRLVYKHQFPLGTPYPDVIGHVARADQIFSFQSIKKGKTHVESVLVVRALLCQPYSLFSHGIYQVCPFRFSITVSGLYCYFTLLCNYRLLFLSSVNSYLK